jgi:hypothetical protein
MLDGSSDHKTTISTIDPKEMSVRTFIKDTEEYGQCF